MGGKGGGGKKGGGGSGDIDVDVDSDSNSTTVLDIVGLDDIDISTTSNSTTTNRLEVPDPIRTRMEMVLDVPNVVRTDQRQRSELAVTEPIVTQTSADVDVDVKPLVVDLCLTLGIKDPPRFCVSRPNHRYLGVSLFGREVVGVRWGGTSDLIVDDVRSSPFVAGVVGRTTGGSHDDHDDHHDHHDHHGHHDQHEHHRHSSAGERESGAYDDHRDPRPPSRERGIRFVID